MAKAHIHAISSSKKFGGSPEDYIDLHEFLDSTKSAVPSNIHRIILHNAWSIKNIIPKIFGSTRINSDGKVYSTIDIAEQHVLEDFGMKFIPTLQDYVSEINFRPWMNNGEGGDYPDSAKPIFEKRKKEKVPLYEIVDFKHPVNSD